MEHFLEGEERATVSLASRFHWRASERRSGSLRVSERTDMPTSKGKKLPLLADSESSAEAQTFQSSIR